MRDEWVEHWPIIAFALGVLWGIIVWMKRQFLDNVYATKKEVNEAKEELEKRMDVHEVHDAKRHMDISETINKHHDEIKNLIIQHLEHNHSKE
jgi:hypothetical protein